MKKILILLALSLSLCAHAQKWSVTDSCNNLIIHNLSTGRLLSYPKQQIWIDTTNALLAIKQINNNAVIASWTPALIGNLPASNLQSGARILMAMMSYNCVHVTGGLAPGGVQYDTLHLPISGSYQPAYAEGENLNDLTVPRLYYTQIDSIITVTGEFFASATIVGNNLQSITGFFLTLPTVGEQFTAPYNKINGVITSVDPDSFGTSVGYVTNVGPLIPGADTVAVFLFVPDSLGKKTYKFTFTYVSKHTVPPTIIAVSGGGGGSSGWSLTGNASTNPSVNFLGTTDNDTLNFRVNNQPAMSVYGVGSLDLKPGSSFFSRVGDLANGYYTKYDFDDGWISTYNNNVETSRIYGNGSMALINSGGFQGALDPSNITNNHAYILPDADGTIALVGGSNPSWNATLAVDPIATTDVTINDAAFTVNNPRADPIINVPKWNNINRQLFLGDAFADYNGTSASLDDISGTWVFNCSGGFLIQTAGGTVKIKTDNLNPAQSPRTVQEADTNYTRVAMVNGAMADSKGNISTPTGSTGTEPGTPQVGLFFYDTTLQKLKFWNGAVWAVITSTP